MTAKEAASKVQGDILVVDDTPASLKLLTDILKTEGYRVRPATDGELAIRSARIQAPDLILLDIRMPDMDGFEVCRQLKASAETRNIPVIFISGLGEPMEKVQGFALGGVDYILKPFENSEVLARVRTHLAIRSMQEQLEVQNIQLRDTGKLLEIQVAERTQELRESENRFRLLAENIEQVFWVGTPDWNQVSYVSPAYEKLCGLKAEDLYVNPRQWIDAVHPDDRAQVIADIPNNPDEIIDYVDFKDYRIINTDGQILWISARAYPVKDSEGNVVGVTGLAQDITQRKQLEEKLKHIATHDPLTGLYNRHEMELRLTDEVERASRYNHHLAVFMLDLDHFKSVNDTYGHLAGDTILKTFATVLNNSIRNTDYVARYGGEEFVVILPETTLPKAEELAERLCSLIAEYPFTVKIDTELKITTSIGIASFPEHAKTGRKLLEAADSALYGAKQAGRNQVKTP